MKLRTDVASTTISEITSEIDPVGRMGRHGRGG
jgi:hypothetical protein